MLYFRYKEKFSLFSILNNCRSCVNVIIYIYALSCGLNANYSFVLFLIRQLEQVSFELTFDPDLQVWWPYPNDPFVCKHGETAVVEGQGHGQKLGHFCGDIWCLWNTFERNYITHQFHRLKVIVFSSISQHFIFCNFSFSFTKTDLINIVQQTYNIFRRKNFKVFYNLIQFEYCTFTEIPGPIIINISFKSEV